MKQITWISENILLLLTLFLLAFIPLYPKLPLLGVNHTFVYIRIEDFLVSAAVIIYLIQLYRKKASFKSPLTIPILLFWLIGLISTLNGIFFIFPQLTGVFPKIAVLFYLRHIEYLSLFFIAYSALKQKNQISSVVSVLTITLISVVLYALGQRFMPAFFPAFSTMNEEFAKGIPLTLSALGRIQSTFAGHYDLAAYLVMMIPLIGSLIFGYKQFWIKSILIFTALLSLIVLLMTASRTSFVMYLAAVMFMLVIQKQKKWIIPVLIISLMLLRSFQGIYSRYVSTLSPVNVIVDARTGKAIGIAKTTGKALEIDQMQSTGENLPPSQSQFVGLQNEKGTASSSSLIIKRAKNGNSTQDSILRGNFVIQKAQALDISITTRFQAEWPNAINAFKRNLYLGSGYSSISLATDGNYFRILGETGIFGFLSFGLIFMVFAIYSVKVLPFIDSKPARSLILGINAGIFGLGLNALLIDVFEASKIAFTLWILIGIGTGVLTLYQKEKINFLKEIKNILFSLQAISLYLFIFAFFVFSPMLYNFFIGDDFTWLRWAADCSKNFSGKCGPLQNIFLDYFLHAQEFFYRPGAKIYYYLLYQIGSFDPLVYHLFSLFIHILVTLMVLFISNKLLRNKLSAAIIAWLFLILSSHAESVFWISSAGHLITSYLIIAGLWFFMLWREKRNNFYLVISLIHVFAAPLFQEMGIIAPVLVMYYSFIYDNNFSLSTMFKKWYFYLFVIQIPFYLWLRLFAGSIWGSGDYAYNLSKLPLNAIGNLMGYLGISLLGPRFMPLYEMSRFFGRANILLTLIFSAALFVGVLFFFSRLSRKIKLEQKQRVLMGLGLFIIPLLPFLGLGNIAFRYVYLSSAGALLMFFALLQILTESIKKQFRYSLYILIGLVLILLGSYNYFELMRINRDWQKAGNITAGTISTVINTFSNDLVPTKNPELFFVNVPLTYGQAWVFPVGLPDAMWFSFKNEKLRVLQFSNVSDAMSKVENPGKTKIFVYDKSGKLIPKAYEQ